MTAEAFRRLALSLPEATEGSHMGHPDFRVGGKIFATLAAPDPSFAMVKLTPDQQEALVSAEPAVFVPVKGGWGLKGRHERAPPARQDQEREGRAGHGLAQRRPAAARGESHADLARRAASDPLDESA